MFSIGLKLLPQADPSIIVFQDDSTISGETLTSRTINITKTVLQTSSIDFPITDSSINLSFDKDYAINLEYEVVTNVNTYSKTVQFVTLGFTNLIKKNREFIAQQDKSLQDRDQFKKETLDINYYKLVAKDRCRFSDLIGAQKALDYIADMNLGDNYTLCNCVGN